MREMIPCEEEKRLEAVEYYLSGHSLIETSKTHGISRMALAKWIERHSVYGNVKCRKRRVNSNRKVDPEKLLELVQSGKYASVRAIASEIGCTETAVSNALAKHKIKFESVREYKSIYREKIENFREANPDATDKQIATELGFAVHTVKNTRRRYGISGGRKYTKQLNAPVQKTD